MGQLHENCRKHMHSKDFMKSNAKLIKSKWLLFRYVGNCDDRDLFHREIPRDLSHCETA